METIKFRHSGNIGDLIYSLPCIKSVCQHRKATIFIQINVPSSFTAEQHPVGAVMINEKMAGMVVPLLMAQDYIHNVIVYDPKKGENIPEVDFDLDLFRKDNLNLSAGNISQWINTTYPELRPNLYEPSITADPKGGYIIVNRTTRYQNLFFDYSLLREYGDVYFVGVESEFKQLAAHNENIKHLIVKDFKEMADYIAGSRLFIGNQSMAFAIAEQLKVKRILEQFAHAPNVIPQGGEYFVAQRHDQFKKFLSLALHGENQNNNRNLGATGAD